MIVDTKDKASSKMITPYWFQDGAIKAVYSYFGSGKKGNPLIALPTGTGKSIVISLLIRSILLQWHSQRVMMLTHVKELISQNANAMIEAWPLAPLGIFSAGLKQRDTALPIVFGGVASVVKNAAQFGWRDILIIDEAHLLSPDTASMYQRVIDELKKINPNLKVIGLTATTYRMGQGSLTDPGGLFTDIIYDLTDVAGFNRLVAEGYLAPLFPKRTRTEYDVSGVKMLNGDYAKGDLEKKVDNRELTQAILQELCYEGANRNHWLVFASGITHAEHITDLLNNQFGVPSVVVHSKLSDDERNSNIAKFKSGEVRCAVNNNVLTTGFNFPAIDLIGMLRPTMSPGLWVQMAGRGTRPSKDTGKRDCIVLDFAGNTRRLGPINDPVRPKPKGQGGAGDAPVRICAQCGTYCPAAATSCYCCGHAFTFQQKLLQTASTDELIRSDAPEIQTVEVARVLYNRHLSRKENAKPCIWVQYIAKSKLQSYSEYIHLDADGRAGKDARDWWRQRCRVEPPRPDNCAPYSSATDAALSAISQLRSPKAIRVWVNRPYPEILSVEY